MTAKNNLKDLAIPSKKAKTEEVEKPKTPILPKGFEDFIESEFCMEMCESILDYCTRLCELDAKKEKLDIDAKSRNIPAPKILKYEVD